MTRSVVRANPRPKEELEELYRFVAVRIVAGASGKQIRKDLEQRGDFMTAATFRALRCRPAYQRVESLLRARPDAPASQTLSLVGKVSRELTDIPSSNDALVAWVDDHRNIKMELASILIDRTVAPKDRIAAAAEINKMNGNYARKDQNDEQLRAVVKARIVEVMGTKKLEFLDAVAFVAAHVNPELASWIREQFQTQTTIS
jgi:hypothetical protein